MEFPNKKQKKTNVRHLHTLEEESVLNPRLQTSSAPTVSSQPRTEHDDDPRVSSQSQITVDRLLYSSDEDGNSNKKFSHQRLPPRILSPSRYLDLMDSQDVIRPTYARTPSPGLFHPEARRLVGTSYKTPLGNKSIAWSPWKPNISPFSPWKNLSTAHNSSRQLVKSLGLDLNNSSVSWTSSLVTPPAQNSSTMTSTAWDQQRQKDVNDGDSSSGSISPVFQGPARKLFSPCSTTQSTEEFYPIKHTGESSVIEHDDLNKAISPATSSDTRGSDITLSSEANRSHSLLLSSQVDEGIRCTDIEGCSPDDSLLSPHNVGIMRPVPLIRSPLFRRDINIEDAACHSQGKGDDHCNVLPSHMGNRLQSTPLSMCVKPRNNGIIPDVSASPILSGSIKTCPTSEISSQPCSGGFTRRSQDSHTSHTSVPKTMPEHLNMEKIASSPVYSMSDPESYCNLSQMNKDKICDKSVTDMDDCDADLENTSQHLFSPPAHMSQRLLLTPTDTKQKLFLQPADTSQRLSSPLADTSQRLFSPPTETSQNLFSQSAEAKQKLYTAAAATSHHLFSPPASTSQKLLSPQSQTSQRLFSQLAETSQRLLSLPAETSKGLLSPPAVISIDDIFSSPPASSILRKSVPRRRKRSIASSQSSDDSPIVSSCKKTKCDLNVRVSFDSEELSDENSCELFIISRQPKAPLDKPHQMERSGEITNDGIHQPSVHQPMPTHQPMPALKKECLQNVHPHAVESHNCDPQRQESKNPSKDSELGVTHQSMPILKKEHVDNVLSFEDVSRYSNPQLDSKRSSDDTDTISKITTRTLENDTGPAKLIAEQYILVDQPSHSVGDKNNYCKGKIDIGEISSGQVKVMSEADLLVDQPTPSVKADCVKFPSTLHGKQDELFTQISQSSLQAFCQAADISHNSPPSDTNKNTHQNVISCSELNAASPLASKSDDRGSSMPVTSRISLRKQAAKRFSYPTTSQISAVCPKRIFNSAIEERFQPLANEANDKNNVKKEKINQDYNAVTTTASSESKSLPNSKRHKRLSSGFTSLSSYKHSTESSTSAALNRTYLSKYKKPSSDHGGGKPAYSNLDVEQVRSSIQTIKKEHTSPDGNVTSKVCSADRVKKEIIAMEKTLQVPNINSISLPETNLDHVHTTYTKHLHHNLGSTDIKLPENARHENTLVKKENGLVKDITVNDKIHKYIDPHDLKDINSNKFIESEVHGMVGFSTARGKKLLANPASLAKAEKLMGEIENDIEGIPKTILNTDVKIKVENSDKGIGEFSKAGCKLIHASKESLMKAMKLMEDSTEDVKIEPANLVGSCDTMASGKKVDTCEKALEKAASLLRDGEDDIKIEVDNNKIENIMPTTIICDSFSTAAGKKIEVSGDALDKVFSLLNKEENDFEGESCDELSAYMPIIETKGDFKMATGGFTMASGKKCEISENALDRALCILNEDESETYGDSRTLPPITSDDSMVDRVAGISPITSDDSVMGRVAGRNLQKNYPGFMPFKKPKIITTSPKDLTEEAKYSNEELCVPAVKKLTASAEFEDSFEELNLTQLREISDSVAALIKLGKNNLLIEEAADNETILADSNTGNEKSSTSKPCVDGNVSMNSEELDNVFKHDVPDGTSLLKPGSIHLNSENVSALSTVRNHTTLLNNNSKPKVKADFPVSVPEKSTFPIPQLLSSTCSMALQDARDVLDIMCEDDWEYSQLASQRPQDVKYSQLVSQRLPNANELLLAVGENVHTVSCNRNSENQKSDSQNDQARIEIPMSDTAREKQIDLRANSLISSADNSAEKPESINSSEAEHLKHVSETNISDTRSPVDIPVVGFQTGSGRQVAVSEGACRRAQRLLSDDSNMVDDHAIVPHTPSTQSSANDSCPEQMLKSPDIITSPKQPASKHKNWIDSHQESHLEPRIFFSQNQLPQKKTLQQRRSFSQEQLSSSTISPEVFDSRNPVYSSQETTSSALIIDKVHTDKIRFDPIETTDNLEVDRPSSPEFNQGNGKCVVMSPKAVTYVKSGLFDQHGSRSPPVLPADTDESWDAPSSPVFGKNDHKSPPSGNITDKLLPPPQQQWDMPSSPEFHTNKGSTSTANKNVEDEDYWENKFSARKGDRNDRFQNSAVKEEIVSCVGFSTARGQTVRVGDKALASANKLLQIDIAESEFSNVGKQMKKEGHMLSGGFSTAAGKKVQVDKKSLASAKKLLENFEIEHTDDVDDKIVNMRKQKGCDGFDDIDNLKVEVVQKPSPNAKSKYRHVKPQLAMVKNEVEMTNGGFITARGKKVEVTKKSLTSAKKLLEDFEAHNQEQDITSSQSDTHTVGGGFSTAKGEKVEVNKKALASARKLIEEPYPEEDGSGDVQERMCAGFSTAKGKKVEVNKKALASAMKLLEGVESDHGPETDKSSDRFTTSKGDKIKFDKKASASANNFLKDVDSVTEGVKPCGFTTGTGRKVKVSEKALLKVRDMFLDSDDVTKDSDSTSSSALNKKRVQTISVKQGNILEERNHKQCMGFTTAKVKVDEKSLASAKHILQDIRDGDNDVVQEKFNKQHSQNIGFSTASGRKVKVDEKSLASAKHILQDIGDADDISSKLKEVPNKDHYPPSMVFSTAAGKTVKVDEKSLASTKQILQDISDADIVVAEENANKRHYQQNMVFSTAAGRKVKVDQKSLASAKQILQDSGNDDNDVTAERVNKKDCQQNIGFSTAAGRKVKVDEKSLASAKQILQDSGNDDNDVTAERVNKKDCQQNIGFSTAAGRKVKVDEKSLASAKHILQDIGNAVQDAPNKDHYPPSMGFSTAAGKKVKVDQKSLASAKQILQDIGDDDNDVTEENVNKKRYQQNMGFSTAAGRKMKVDQKSLASAKQILQDIDKDVVEERVDKKEFKQSIGFSRAAGREVKEDEKSLASAKHILQDIGDSDDVRAKLEDAPNKEHYLPSMGFSTAAGKKVKVDEKSLASAKQILQDIGDNDNVLEKEKHIPKNEPYTQIMGFSTAAGRKVKVDEKSLASAKQILQNIGDNDDDNDERVEKKAIVGFSTAAGKDVDVDKNALANAMLLLEEDMTQSTSANIPMDGLKTEPEEKSICAAKSLHREKYGGNVRSKPGTISDSAVTSQDENDTERWMVSDADRLFSSTSGNHAKMVAGSSSDKDRAVHSGNVTGTDLSQSSMAYAIEAEESKRALLADGTQFDSSWISGDRYVTDCEDKKMTPLLPVVTSPEENFDDRHTDVTLLPLITCPEESEKSYTSESRKMPIHHRKIIQPRKDAFNLSNNDNQVPQNKGTSFHSPFKGTSDSASNATPTKSNDGSTSSFSTPYKKPEPTSSFKTPVKPKKESPSNENKAENTGKDSTEMEDIDIDGLMQGIETEGTERCKVSAEIAKKRLQARVAQAQRIRVKRNDGDTRPSPGSLWSSRQNTADRVPLQEAVQGNLPCSYSRKQLYTSGVLMATCTVTSSNAGDFRFDCAAYFGESVCGNAESVQLADGATLVLGEDGSVGKQEFTTCLLDCAGVAPHLISKEWIHNHYRWIVWQMAALEIAFPFHFGGRCLTPDQVMLRLKYRYDREIDASHRSCLKKIYERDDTPQKSLVLCVSDIIHSTTEANKDTGNNVRLELTDGWYSIKACIDPALVDLVNKGRVRVGDKLVMYGAELLGPADGTPPLEAPADVQLKIFANSTRRARWYARLGYCRHPQPPPLPICSLLPRGGLVGCVDVIITRVYPLQYMEKHTDGGNVFRGERTEVKVAAAYERHKQKHMEAMSEQLQQQYERANTNALSEKKVQPRQCEVAGMKGGPELLEAWQSARDPELMESWLTDRQHQLLQDQRRLEQDQKRAEYCDKLQQQQKDQVQARNVVSLLKVRITGCGVRDIDTATNALLTVWRPADDMTDLLSEGSRLFIFNLMASEARGRGERCKVSLTATRTTSYKPQSIDENLLDLVYQPREVSNLRELIRTSSTALREVDVVGVIIDVSAASTFERNSGDTGLVQNVYLADSERYMAVIKFWGCLLAHGVEDLLRPGVMVCCSNVQTAGRRDGLPALKATEMTHITTNPRQHHLQRAVKALHAEITDASVFLQEMRCTLDCILSRPAQSLNLPSSRISPEVVNSRATRLDAQDSHTASPVISKSIPRPSSTESVRRESVENKISHSAYHKEVRTLSGEQPADPVTEKKKALQRSKLHKLDMYGPDASLGAVQSPIPSALRRAFKPPTPAGDPQHRTSSVSHMRSDSTATAEIEGKHTAPEHGLRASRRVTVSPPTSLHKGDADSHDVYVMGTSDKPGAYIKTDEERGGGDADPECEAKDTSTPSRELSKTRAPRRKRPRLFVGLRRTSKRLSGNKSVLTQVGAAVNKVECKHPIDAVNGTATCEQSINEQAVTSTMPHNTTVSDVSGISVCEVESSLQTDVLSQINKTDKSDMTSQLDNTSEVISTSQRYTRSCRNVKSHIDVTSQSDMSQTDASQASTCSSAMTDWTSDCSVTSSGRTGMDQPERKRRRRSLRLKR